MIQLRLEIKNKVNKWIMDMLCTVGMFLLCICGSSLGSVVSVCRCEGECEWLVYLQCLLRLSLPTLQLLPTLTRDVKLNYSRGQNLKHSLSSRPNIGNSLYHTKYRLFKFRFTFILDHMRNKL